ncbi:sigma-70 family RNA polymerase sigma factor [Streptomyces sp. NPDC005904]|uniref:sigma-70 family RNA polymerase sigma factor n=1 Tax=Streptomyces sp. NPDC005904 TaxID=3154570 RepID=UPI0033F43AB2
MNTHCAAAAEEDGRPEPEPESGRGRGPDAGPDAGSDPGAITRERRQLINVAYRLMGSLTDAEDVVQETYTRWYAMSPQRRRAVASPGAWLTTVAGRICLDLLRSARARRESYVGQWLPEPLPDRTEWVSGRTGGETADPADQITLDESVDMAFLVVLESMTPAERVAFILHDVFRYSFAEVAEVVGRSQGACRQLASSGRRRVRASHVPGPGAGRGTSADTRTTDGSAAAQRAEAVRDFKQAWEAMDIDALVGILDPDARGLADGGGLVNAGPPTGGSEEIARHLVAVASRVAGMTILERTVNGRPGLVVRQGGVIRTVLAFHVVGGRITRLWAVRNPEKLAPWQGLPAA